jgi:PPOX class probable F420-dependent enzyme
MQKMTPEEYRAFLLQGTRTGKLATVRPNGDPHVAPIWFVLDGEMLVFVTSATSRKGRNMQHNPHVAICVDEETPPYSFVIVEGSVSTSSDPDERLQWATTIARRYMGESLAERYGRRNSAEGVLLVRVTPTKVIAERNIAD